MINKINYTYRDNLETPRLITRFLKNEDAVKWARFLSNSECTKFFPQVPGLSIESKAEQWIEKQILRYSEKRFGLQALIDKQTGEMVGQCGLLLQEVDGVEELEVGYHIFREFWGRGYAPEAARAFINYGFQEKLSNSIISIIHSENTNSQRVAAKNNLKLDKQTIWRDVPALIFRT